MTTETIPALGNYQIVRAVGSGGMSTVYEAIDSKLKRPVAIKVLHTHLVRDSTARERFRREALAAAKMDHPNIVRIYDYVDSNRTCSIVMEFVSGPDMESVVRERGAMPFETAWFIMWEVAAALQEAHSQGILHRDVKPSNILIHRSGRVMLSDFGLARQAIDGRLTQGDAVAGTPCYMSPEQISNADVDFATDVYSWAVTLHTILSGRLPYKHQAFPDIVSDIQHGRVVLDPLVRRVMPGRCLDILERCLIAAPHDRIRNGAQLREQMGQGGEPARRDLNPLVGAMARSPMPSPNESDISATQIYRAQRPSPLNTILYLVGAAFLGAVLFAGALWYVDHSNQETKRIPPKTVSIDSSKLREEIVRELIRNRLLGDTGAEADDTAAPQQATSSIPELVPVGRSPRKPKPPSVDSGQLFVYSDPWANIIVDGKQYGRTPLEEPITLPEGKHMIRLYNDFCEPLEDTVEVVPRTVVRRRYTLEVKSAYRR